MYDSSHPSGAPNGSGVRWRRGSSPARRRKRSAFVPAGTVGEQDTLVVVADLVAEMAEDRAVRLAESNPQRFAAVVQRLGEIKRDDPVGVADHHPLAVL